MTVEHKVVLGLRDIRAIVCECTHCGARLSLDPASVDPLKLSECPSCGKWWGQTTMTHGQYFMTPEFLLLAALKTARNPIPGAPENGVRVLFEFDEPAR